MSHQRSPERESSVGMAELGLKYKVGDILQHNNYPQWLRIMRIIDVAWESVTCGPLEDDVSCCQMYIAEVYYNGRWDTRSMNQHRTDRQWTKTTALAVLVKHGIEVEGSCIVQSLRRRIAKLQGAV